MLYWEYGNQTAVRYGKWKAVESNKRKKSRWELFDLEKDIGEQQSIAEAYPEILTKMQAFAKASHEPVRSGTYHDEKQVRHQKDRKAKWGAAGPPESARKPNTAKRVGSKK